MGTKSLDGFYELDNSAVDDRELLDRLRQAGRLRNGCKALKPIDYTQLEYGGRRNQMSENILAKVVEVLEERTGAKGEVFDCD